jgi:hypothetical protein
MIIEPGIDFPYRMDWGVILHENKTWLPTPRDLIFQNKLV